MNIIGPFFIQICTLPTIPSCMFYNGTFKMDTYLRFCVPSQAMNPSLYSSTKLVREDSQSAFEDNNFTF